MKVKLPLKFLVENDAKNACRGTGVNRRSVQNKGERGVMLCPSLGEVHKDILLWSKRCPMLLRPLQALLVDHWQCSTVLLCQFAKG